jgi:hypothetical protein
MAGLEDLNLDDLENELNNIDLGLGDLQEKVEVSKAPSFGLDDEINMIKQSTIEEPNIVSAAPIQEPIKVKAASATEYPTQPTPIASTKPVEVYSVPVTQVVQTTVQTVDLSIFDKWQPSLVWQELMKVQLEDLYKA